MAKAKEKVELKEEDLGDLDISGNGHKEISQAEIEAFNKKQEERSIPGIASLYRVDDKWLGEVTDLNEREIAAYAVGDMQQGLADPKRTKSAYELLRNSAFRYKISKVGKGRDDQVILHRLEADMKAQGLTGGGTNFAQP